MGGVSEPFQTCWFRIQLAHNHRDNIGKLWSAFLRKEPYVTRPYVQNDGTGQIKISQVKEIPWPIKFEFGYFLYHLRAALDAAIYETACAEEGKRPPTDEKFLEFPITESANDFKKARWKLGPLTQEQRDIVETMQPYAAPTNLKPEELPLSVNRAMGILNDWARKDRHRYLHVVGTQGTPLAPPMFRVPEGVSVKRFDFMQSAFMLESEHVIATFELDGWRPNMYMEANANLAIDIGVDEIPPPCHHTDTMGRRQYVMELAVASVIARLSKSVKIDPPEDFRIDFTPQSGSVHI